LKVGSVLKLEHSVSYYLHIAAYNIPAVV